LELPRFSANIQASWLSLGHDTDCLTTVLLPFAYRCAEVLELPVNEILL
jgi:hypothetical protein